MKEFFKFLIAFVLLVSFTVESAETIPPADLAQQIKENRLKVSEFKKIAELAQQSGLRVYLFGGTAAGLAHYVKWHTLFQKGDTRFQPHRFDYDYTNIYRSNQDLDIVVTRADGGVESDQEVQKFADAIKQMFPHSQGNKKLWEVRSLKTAYGNKGILLLSEDFRNQHTDSNSTALIELTNPAPDEPIVRDLFDWEKEVGTFIQDVANNEIHLYFSQKHGETPRAKEGINPPIEAVIRYLIKAFQYELAMDPQSLAHVEKIIADFNPEEQRRYEVNHWIEYNGKKLIENAVDVEYAWNVLEKLGLRQKLIDLNHNEKVEKTLAWWMSKEPLRSAKHPLQHNDRRWSHLKPGKTAEELGIKIVAHETSDFFTMEAITRSHQGAPNVLISRDGFPGEASAFYDGFYTLLGLKGAKGTGFHIRFDVDPSARENVDFVYLDSMKVVIWRTRDKLQVIPESTKMNPLRVLDFLVADENKDEIGQRERLMRRLRSYEWTPQISRQFAKRIQEMLMSLDTSSEKFRWIYRIPNAPGIDQWSQRTQERLKKLLLKKGKAKLGQDRRVYLWHFLSELSYIKGLFPLMETSRSLLNNSPFYRMVLFEFLLKTDRFETIVDMVPIDDAFDIVKLLKALNQVERFVPDFFSIVEIDLVKNYPQEAINKTFLDPNTLKKFYEIVEAVFQRNNPDQFSFKDGFFDLIFYFAKDHPQITQKLTSIFIKNIRYRDHKKRIQFDYLHHLIRFGFFLPDEVLDAILDMKKDNRYRDNISAKNNFWNAVFERFSSDRKVLPYYEKVLRQIIGGDYSEIHFFLHHFTLPEMTPFSDATQGMKHMETSNMNIFIKIYLELLPTLTDSSLRRQCWENIYGFTQTVIKSHPFRLKELKNAIGEESTTLLAQEIVREFIDLQKYILEYEDLEGTNDIKNIRNTARFKRFMETFLEGRFYHLSFADDNKAYRELLGDYLRTEAGNQQLEKLLSYGKNYYHTISNPYQYPKEIFQPLADIIFTEEVETFAAQRFRSRYGMHTQEGPKSFMTMKSNGENGPSNLHPEVYLNMIQVVMTTSNTQYLIPISLLNWADNLDKETMRWVVLLLERRDLFGELNAYTEHILSIFRKNPPSEAKFQNQFLNRFIEFLDYFYEESLLENHRVNIDFNFLLDFLAILENMPLADRSIVRKLERIVANYDIASLIQKYAPDLSKEINLPAIASTQNNKLEEIRVGLENKEIGPLQETLKNLIEAQSYRLLLLQESKDGSNSTHFLRTHPELL